MASKQASGTFDNDFFFHAQASPRVFYIFKAYIFAFSCSNIYLKDLKVLNSPQITPKKLLIHLEVMTALRQQIVSLVCTNQISIAPVLDSKELAS